jgi:DNA-binding NarL/FixJ family response regulator
MTEWLKDPRVKKVGSLSPAQREIVQHLAAGGDVYTLSHTHKMLFDTARSSMLAIFQLLDIDPGDRNAKFVAGELYKAFQAEARMPQPQPPPLKQRTPEAGDDIDLAAVAARISTLVPRHKEILNFLGRGFDRDVIAAKLNIKETSVATEICHIYKGLGMQELQGSDKRQRTAAASVLFKNGNFDKARLVLSGEYRLHRDAMEDPESLLEEDHALVAQAGAKMHLLEQRHLKLVRIMADRGNPTEELNITANTANSVFFEANRLLGMPTVRLGQHQRYRILAHALRKYDSGDIGPSQEVATLQEEANAEGVAPSAHGTGVFVPLTDPASILDVVLVSGYFHGEPQPTAFEAKIAKAATHGFRPEGLVAHPPKQEGELALVQLVFVRRK